MKPINQRRQQASQAPSEAPGGANGQRQSQAQGQGDYTSGSVQATPDEQNAYERVILAGTEMLYADQSHEQILNILKKEAGTPEDAIASVVVLLTTQIDKKSGGTVPEGVLFAAIEEFVEQAGTLANEAGVFAVDEALLNRAGQKTLMLLGDYYDLDEQDVQEFMNMVDPAEAEKYVAQQRQYAEAGGGGPAGQGRQARAGGAGGQV